MEKGRVPSLLLLMAVALASCLSPAICHNITAILNNFPDYTVQNNYMSSTKIADEVNSRQTLTCLVLPNAVMSALAANHNPPSLKKALQLLVLLDYFDPQKLHDIDGGTTITTTLFQTTGEAIGEQGFVNITNLRGGRVAFGSAIPGSKLTSDYTKSVRQIPYNISILEISDPIIFPGLIDDGAASDRNLTAILETAGCKIFASLISSSGMIKIFQAAMVTGLTLFAPNDEAFKAKGVPDPNSLSSADLVTLLQYHAIASYIPKDSLKTAHHPIATMASGAAGNYEITVSVQGDDVTIHTGVDSSRIARTVLDETPVCVLTMESVLLPEELFGKAPAPAPAEANVTPIPQGATPVSAPAPTPKLAKVPTPAPAFISPPESPVTAPATESPVTAPASESPDEAADKEDDKSLALVVKVSSSFVGLAAAVAVLW
ncbi:fasciclin-like arabinogalactan protein 8 [Phalaenopsis equestris]|uniref:fasciclin-like arabinogalactan protein 8 n=1 Tax=Phalaenopsis equestris TaxID=78828 RepID=UPI0009E27822|nr:fasciclin-like arabinogalactan protein 8 [Phalaenopsis equestris]